MLAAKTNEPDWAFIHRQLAIAFGRAGLIANANLSLAEEAILLGDEQQAVRMAKRVLTGADLTNDVRNRANDILFRFDRPISRNSTSHSSSDHFAKAHSIIQYKGPPFTKMQRNSCGINHFRVYILFIDLFSYIDFWPKYSRFLTIYNLKQIRTHIDVT